VKPFLGALQFLTILPLPRNLDVGQKALGQGVWFFPVVGLLIGAAVAGVDYGVSGVLPAMPASVIVVVLLLLISGGLHLDGLADTADGFLSSRPRERILEIMKDSRSGPMAIAAVVCVLSLKMTSVAPLEKALDHQRTSAILLMALAGRCALVFQLNLLPYARKDGLGLVFFNSRSRLQAVWALVLLTAASWFLLRRVGVDIVAGVVLVNALFALLCYRKIGGFTGDTLGAACELSEIVPPLVLAGWLHVHAAA
jgi:adenosylcobinamide-GDP ribazoletransferase